MSTMCSMFSATDQASLAGLKSHCAGDRPPTDSSRNPRVTERRRDAVVISSVVSPVSAMIVDEVLFTVPPWNRGARVELKRRRRGSGVSGSQDQRVKTRKLREDHDGPDFDAAESSGWDAGCNRGCFVDAGRFD